MAPETLINNEYSLQSDIWAVGVIFLEMLTGSIPWKAKSEKELRVELQTFKLDDILPGYISERSKAFLQKCLEKSKEKRMNLEQLTEFSFQAEFSQSSIEGCSRQIGIELAEY